MDRILIGTLLVMICVSSLMVTSGIPSAKSSPSTGNSWLTGWTYRKSHTIDNAVGAGVNYTMPITVINGTGTDTGNTIFVYNKTKSDFSDIRFTSSDGSTQLYYWNETVNVGVSASFWFKDIDNLTAASSTIYVYYGNPNVSWDTAYCNIANTFVFGDDFQGSSVPPTGWTSSLIGTQQFNEEQTNSWYQLYNFSSTFLAWSGVFLSQAIPSINGGFWVRARMSSNATLGDDGEGQLVVMLYENATNNFHIGFDDGWIATTGLIASAINGTDGSSLQGSQDGANPPIVLEVSRDQNNMARTYYNGAIQQSATGVTSGFNNITLRLTAGETVPNQIAAVDYVWVRNYINPEPVQGTWGTEESWSATVFGYTDKPLYEPSDSGVLRLWVYNSGNRDLVLDNFTILYPWYDPAAAWAGGETILPFNSTVIQPAGTWNITATFTVPNDGRISSGKLLINVYAFTDKAILNASIPITLGVPTYYSAHALQDMNQLQTLLTILIAALVICTLIIAAAILVSKRKPKMPKP